MAINNLQFRVRWPMAAPAAFEGIDERVHAGRPHFTTIKAVCGESLRGPLCTPSRDVGGLGNVLEFSKLMNPVHYPGLPPMTTCPSCTAKVPR